MSPGFFIKFPIEPFKIINESSKIIMVGSCFSEHIGIKFNNTGFVNSINPFGILFNPVSIANCLVRTCGNETYTREELYRNPEGRFISFDHHGYFSGINENKVMEEINASLIAANQSLKIADCCII